MALSRKQRRKINELSIITWMLFLRLRDEKGWITDVGDRARYSDKSIKVSRTQGCLKISPKHIYQAAHVCEGSAWSTCLAAVLDKYSPPLIDKKAKGAIVFDELVRQGYFATN